MSLSVQPSFKGNLHFKEISINTNLESKLSKRLSSMPYNIHVEKKPAPYRELCGYKIRVSHNNGDEVIINKPSTTLIGDVIENIINLLQLGK